MSYEREWDERELAEAKRELEWAVTDREKKEARLYVQGIRHKRLRQQIVLTMVTLTPDPDDPEMAERYGL